MFSFPSLPESPDGDGGTDEAQTSPGRASKSAVSRQQAPFARKRSFPELKATLEAHSPTPLCYPETAYQREEMPQIHAQGPMCQCHASEHWSEIRDPHPLQ